MTNGKGKNHVARDESGELEDEAHLQRARPSENSAEETLSDASVSAETASGS